MSTTFDVADCLSIPLPDKSVDLVFCSPPYEDARTYGIDFTASGQDWVDWAVPRFKECLRVCRGLVAWVVEGRTRQYRWSATPVMFMADLHRSGVNLRKPPAYHRVGIPGSGGPDWLRNDYEFIVCGTNGGKLPWSDNTAMGEPCKYGPGGVPTHRLQDGTRANVAKMRSLVAAGTSQRQAARQCGVDFKTTTSGTDDGGTVTVQTYVPPERANPGNVIRCVVGGGKMGHPLAHENEAPFPESLAEFFVQSFCPPGGVVLDPFSGSGTTVCVADRLGRVGVGFDIRESQVELGRRRLTSQRLATAEPSTN